MSQENVDLIREAASAFNAEGSLEAWAGFWDSDIVWHTDPFVPEPGVYSGKEAVRAYLEGFNRAIGVHHVEVEDVIDLGGDEVLAVTTVSGHPLGATNRDTQFIDWAFIYTLRDGTITRIRSFFDKEKAFEAAGLRESLTPRSSRVNTTN